MPGGGVALIRCAQNLEDIKLKGDELVGALIVKKAIEEPLKHIASNAGQAGEVVLEKVKELKGSVGYNAEKDKYEDLIEAGVIDPTKVTRTALQNAASISALLLTTESLITDLPEEKSAMPAMPPGGGMGGMGGGMY